MRNSRIAAVLGAAAIVVAGAVAVPAGAVTAPAPTRPTAIVTAPGVATQLLTKGVGLQTIGAASMSVVPTLTGAQVGITFPSTKVNAVTLAHTGSFVLIHGTHIVTLANLTITINPVTKTGAVSALFSVSGAGAPKVTTVFGVRGVTLTPVKAWGHTWTKVTGNIIIPSALVSTTLTLGLGLSSPIFPAGATIATATAYVLVA